MTPADATRLLELPDHASPEQIEARYNELRTRLEDKIAKAPTPGLKAKYRESLDEITAAFETLTLAADASALPVLKREQGEGSREQGRPMATGGGRREAGTSGPSPSSLHPAPAPRRKSGWEFVVVAIIAVAVLGAGAWWVMKTRAEKAEQARIAAEAKAEADRKAAAEKAEQERKAEEARLAAEAKRKAEEEEKARIAAAEKAEADRQEKLTGQLRAELAGLKVRWEALEKEERAAERRVAELKSDLRSLRDVEPGVLAEAQALAAAHQNYYEWLSSTLARHPARVARSKAEELLSARQPDAASEAMTELRQALGELETELPEQRRELTSIRGRLRLSTADTASWTITDAFGQTRTGEGGGEIGGLAVGRARLTIRKALWPDRDASVTIRSGTVAEYSAPYETQGVDLASTPDGAKIFGPDGQLIGETPARIELPPGKWTVTLRREGYVDQKVELPRDRALAGDPVVLRVKPAGLVKPERWQSPVRLATETRVNMTGSSSSNTHILEEWELAQPDPTRGWLQITRKFVSYTGTNANYAPVAGSIVRQHRQPDGKWTGNFLQGGLSDSSLNYIWEAAGPSLWIATLGMIDVWPAEEVPPGGTWPVRSEVFFPMIGLTSATGQVTGKLLSIERGDSGDLAIVEFAYNYAMSGMNGQASIKVHINLSECYVTRMEGRDYLTHSGGAITNNYSTTVTKR